MPIFYKGAGPGTWWDIRRNDANTLGFAAGSPGGARGVNQIRDHIRFGSRPSAYISLTRSYAIAWDYAVYGGGSTVLATKANPGYVYHIELTDPLPGGVSVVDPLAELANGYGSVCAPISYHHRGHQNFIIGVADQNTYGAILQQPVRWPHGNQAVTAPGSEFIAMVNALRDAEVLVVGTIPRNAIIHCETIVP